MCVNQAALLGNKTATKHGLLLVCKNFDQDCYQFVLNCFLWDEIVKYFCNCYKQTSEITVIL